jgi:Phosphotransferase enzyme family
MNANPLPRDRALPHLATALDARAMADVFGTRLASEGGATLTACRVDRIKYRPQRNFSASYVLSLRDAQGRAFEQAVGTRWCTGGESAQRHTKALRRPHRPSPAGPSLWHIDALDMAAAWLPNDPKLDGVREMLDDERLRDHWLPAVAAELAPGPSTSLRTGRRVISHRTTLVQWMPEHRACARVDLELASGTGTDAHTLYVKTDAEGGGGITHAAMLALHLNRRLRTPRSIAWQPAAGLHWQTAIEGRPLAEFGSALGPRRGEQVGELIALLHATPVSLPVARGVTIDDLRRERRRAALVVASVDAEWATRAADIVRMLERADAALPSLRPATLHGDLHRVNLMVGRDDTLAMIDFDSMRRGPAALELGSWIADSMVLALLEGQPAATTAPQWRAMLRAYADVSRSVAMPDEPVLAWATAHQLLVQRAYRCIANLKPGRLAIVPAVLALAQAIVREGTLEVEVK